MVKPGRSSCYVAVVRGHEPRQHNGHAVEIRSISVTASWGNQRIENCWRLVYSELLSRTTGNAHIYTTNDLVLPITSTRDEILSKVKTWIKQPVFGLEEWTINEFTRHITKHVDQLLKEMNRT
jgi:hypothetical protein